MDRNQEMQKAYHGIMAQLSDGIQLVAVSKTKPQDEIMTLYTFGQRDFGENYVQELVDKQASLPADIRWHFIGHLQSNKVKYIAPFVHLVHGVDSLRLLKEIDRQAARRGRVIDCLLQVHIAREETKFGLDDVELDQLMKGPDLQALSNSRVRGLMGMASFTDDPEKVRAEFKGLKTLFDQYFPGGDAILSMGMSGDYTIAMEEGSTMVRIGSLLFGKRG